MLKLEEKYFMAFSYQNIYDLIKFKPLRVKQLYELTFSKIGDSSDLDLIVADHVYPQRSTDFMQIFRLKSLTFYIKDVDISVYDPISSSDLLMLLSSKTKSLKFWNVTFNSPITFQEILQKAPKLEKIDIFKANVQAGTSWPNDLLQFNTAEKLRNIHLSIIDLNFNIEDLVAIMKQKSANFINISLYIHLKVKSDFTKIAESAKIKFSTYFIQERTYQRHCVSILFSNGDEEEHRQFYTLKEFIGKETELEMAFCKDSKCTE